MKPEKVTVASHGIIVSSILKIVFGYVANPYNATCSSAVVVNLPFNHFSK